MYEKFFKPSIVGNNLLDEFLEKNKDEPIFFT